MRFTLNLTTTRHIDQRVVTLSLMVIIVVSLLVTVYNAFRVAQNHADIRKVEGQLAAITGEFQKGTGVSEKEYNALRASVTVVNDMLEQKNKEWLLLFQRLEETVPPGVAIINCSPDMKNRLLKLQCEATNFASMRRFVESLQGSPHFHDVSLETHAISDGNDGPPRVTFSLSCKGDFL